MVEAAFVMPIFVLFIFGIIEFAGVLMSKEGTANAAQAGARMASVQANFGMADQQILIRIHKEAAGIPNGEIKQIVIWHASGPNDTVPSACLSASQTMGGGDAIGACNLYDDPEASGGAFEDAEGSNPTLYFGCPIAPSPLILDCSFKPQDRKVEQQKAGTGTPPYKTPDYVGIYIKAVHKYYTGIFGATVTTSETSIGKIEPQSYVST